MILKLLKKREVSKVNRKLTSKLILLTIFTFLLFFSFTSNTSASTESTAIIRENCALKSIPSANCYTSLSAWETAEQRDLTATDEIAVARIEGTWTNPDTTPVTIDGWTTDATRYIKIYTTTEARHTGKWDNTRYRLESGNFGAKIVNNQQDYTRI
ncbi:MAG: hypothetical protein COU71_00525, partial [Parcubacteria group bacterium CG10_big_fil_rev_8_21_14_0_10_38_31]